MNAIKQNDCYRAQFSIRWHSLGFHHFQPLRDLDAPSATLRLIESIVSRY